MKSFKQVKYKNAKVFITKAQKQWLADNQVKTGVKPTDLIRQIVKDIINERKQLKDDTIG